MLSVLEVVADSGVRHHFLAVVHEFLLLLVCCCFKMVTYCIGQMEQREFVVLFQ